MFKKSYIYLGLGLVVIVSAAVLFALKVNRGSNVPVVSLSPSPEMSESPSPSVSQVSNPKATPGVRVGEFQKTYMQWAIDLDRDNRYIVVNDGCETITPSNVVYKNNTMVMLDNSASNEAYVLKIGDQSYSLDAHNWYLVTLSTNATLPADLGVYCRGVELGSIRLE